MKDCDNSIELVLCGSCTDGLPTYMDWDRTALQYTGELADYLSIHRYVGNRENDTADYLACGNYLDRLIEAADAVCRYVQAKNHSKKRAYICVDEWNVWYKNMEMNGRGTFAPHLLEEVYNLEDALVVAVLLNSLLRHADVVKIANLAQIVNVIAPILTTKDALLAQSIFYPFEMVSRRREGLSLQAVVEGPSYEGKTNGKVNYIDASAILGDGCLHLFLVNRCLTENLNVKVNLADRAFKSVRNGEVISGRDPKAANIREDPNIIKPAVFNKIKLSGEGAEFELPPLSFTAITLELA